MSATADGSTFQAVARDLDRVVADALPLLARFDEDASLAVRPGGRWCRREILGHLVDSATNNHQRFVRAQMTDPLVFPGYAQEEWVALQGYRDAPWARLLPLWHAVNRHLVHVVERIPEGAAARTCRIGEGAPVTLGYVAEDYVRHLRHHLAQILEPAEAAGRAHPPFA